MGRDLVAAVVRQAATSVTVERAEELLRLIADTPAPSGASSLTRGTKIRDWAERELTGTGACLRLDVERSGCDVLSHGTGGVRVLAHLDEVSYLVAGEMHRPGRWPLVPYCYHLAAQPAPARVVRVAADGKWSVTGHGSVVATDDGYEYVGSAGQTLAPGDRVCLAADLDAQSSNGRVTGSLDNAAGVAASLLAGEVLARCGVPFTVVLTDEEEGPAGASSQTISRGASRYFRRAPDAPVTVVVDIHGLAPAEAGQTHDHTVPWGASLAEFSSSGRGSVAPPQLYASTTGYLCGDNGIASGVRPNVGGYVPRSDDVVAMTRSNRVLVLGYPGLNRHFDNGLPTANLHDLTELTRALIALGVGIHTGRLAVDW